MKAGAGAEGETGRDGQDDGEEVGDHGDVHGDHGDDDSSERERAREGGRESRQGREQTQQRRYGGGGVSRDYRIAEGQATAAKALREPKREGFNNKNASVNLADESSSARY